MLPLPAHENNSAMKDPARGSPVMLVSEGETCALTGSGDSPYPRTMAGGQDWAALFGKSKRILIAAEEFFTCNEDISRKFCAN